MLQMEVFSAGWSSGTPGYEDDDIDQLQMPTSNSRRVLSYSMERLGVPRQDEAITAVTSMLARLRLGRGFVMLLWVPQFILEVRCGLKR